MVTCLFSAHAIESHLVVLLAEGTGHAQTDDEQISQTAAIDALLFSDLMKKQDGDI